MTLKTYISGLYTIYKEKDASLVLVSNLAIFSTIKTTDH